MANICLGIFKTVISQIIGRLCISLKADPFTYLYLNPNGKFSETFDPKATVNTKNLLSKGYDVGALGDNLGGYTYIADVMLPFTGDFNNLNYYSENSANGRYPIANEYSSVSYSSINRMDAFSSIPYGYEFAVGMGLFNYTSGSQSSVHAFGIIYLRVNEDLTFDIVENDDVDLSTPAVDDGFDFDLTTNSNPFTITHIQLGGRPQVITDEITSKGYVDTDAIPSIVSGMWNKAGTEFALIVELKYQYYTPSASHVKDVKTRQVVTGTLEIDTGELKATIADYGTPQIYNTENADYFLDLEDTPWQLGYVKEHSCNFSATIDYHLAADCEKLDPWQTGNGSGSGSGTAMDSYHEESPLLSRKIITDIDYNDDGLLILEQHFQASYLNDQFAYGGGSGSVTTTWLNGSCSTWDETGTNSGSDVADLDHSITNDLLVNDIIKLKLFDFSYTAHWAGEGSGYVESASCMHTQRGGTSSLDYTEDSNLFSSRPIYTDARHDLYLVEEYTLTQTSTEHTATGVNQTVTISQTYKSELVVYFKGEKTILFTMRDSTYNSAEWLEIMWHNPSIYTGRRTGVYNMSFDFRRGRETEDIMGTCKIDDVVIEDVLKQQIITGDTSSPDSFFDSGSAKQNPIELPPEAVDNIVPNFVQSGRVEKLSKWIKMSSYDGYIYGSGAFPGTYLEKHTSPRNDNIVNANTHKLLSGACDGENYILYLNRVAEIDNNDNVIHAANSNIVIFN
ncbi:MAG: hypothetical protein GY694_05980, partial [Gammaproteobacteria bacterium]|nr:hypothetical protein [Gammaproteobacteria bacterium]